MLLAWSGGKDAALALETLEQNGHSVTGLVTTVGRETGRTSMHGVRRMLMYAQAAAVGLPLHLIEVPGDGTRDGYQEVMQEALAALDADEIAYADLYLEDIREYREELLEEVGYSGRWPLWGQDTNDLVNSLLDREYRCITVAIDGSALSPGYLGRELSWEFQNDLPPDVDPCGEKGEFHTFVVDAPTFSDALSVRRGRRVTNELGGTPFHFVDLIPGTK